MKRLTNVKSGNTAVMLSIDGGRHAQMRLAEMGFVPGVVIQVIGNAGIGPVFVIIKGTKLALGHGLAGKIVVKEESNG